MIASTGEQVCVGLLAIALHADRQRSRLLRRLASADQDRQRVHQGAHPVESTTAACAPISTQARSSSSPASRASIADGNIATLGRGGSDTSAVAIAAALKADECLIYTDVDGVYTTDPRVVDEARRLDTVTFEEMLEMATLGSKVLQIRSVEFAGKYQVPTRVLSSPDRPADAARRRSEFGHPDYV